MSKEQSAPERTEREIPTHREHVGHVEVEAHGVIHPEFTIDQYKSRNMNSPSSTKGKASPPAKSKTIRWASAMPSRKPDW
jgi:hypothetical protein